MCGFISFWVSSNGEIICEPPYNSHTPTPDVVQEHPQLWREAEWVDEEARHLSVRTAPEDHGENWYRSAVWAKYPTRSSFLVSLGTAVEESANGKKFWYRDGELHRDDGPAREYPDGHKDWYRNGKLHRDNGPAREYPDGHKDWYRNGKLHRDDGPAMEYASGGKDWYRDGELHRDDGPAVEYPDGTKQWYRDGKLHRDDGPAVEYANGKKYWYRDGKLCEEPVNAA